MPLPITALYAAILAIILTALAINVTVHRGKLKVPLGPGDNPTMLRMIRIHGNAAEYIPIALLLMGAYEINGGNHVALHISGVVLILARLLHASGMWNSPLPNFGRVSGAEPDMAYGGSARRAQCNKNCLSTRPLIATLRRWRIE